MFYIIWVDEIYKSLYSVVIYIVHNVTTCMETDFNQTL